MEFERRALRPNDVAIKITYAGICHSDLHTCRNDWGGTRYPVIPGHEIVGIVTAIGDEVTRHRVGDTVAVTFVDRSGVNHSTKLTLAEDVAFEIAPIESRGGAPSAAPQAFRDRWLGTK
jgi:threonine dehydrogenase-like Zn-dependent dehydrogenase